MNEPDHHNDSPHNADSDEAAVDPFEVIREVYREIEFEWDEADDSILTRVALRHLEVSVVCTVLSTDVLHTSMLLPLRATPEVLPHVGEFLHRLNSGSKRKAWEIDCDSGQILLTLYSDICLGPITPAYFRSVIHYLAGTADATFPFLTGVLTGRMRAEFAADQADAAILAEFTSITEDE